MEKDPLVFSDPRDVPYLDKVPVRRKLAYGVGSLAYSMCNTILGFYLTVFLLEVALLSPTYVLVIVLLGRVWDGITDPIVGFLCSRTKTKLGQFRPWLFASAVPLAVVYVFLWFVLHTDNQLLQFFYSILFYFGVQTLLTCIHVPFTALNVHLSYNQKEVDSVTLYRLVFEVLGTLLGISIYTVSYGIFVGGNEDACFDSTRGYDTNKERAYRYHAVVIGIVAISSILVTAFSVKEQKDEMINKSKISFFAGIRETFGFKPYRELILMTLFSWLALQFVQGNYVFYIKYGIGLSNQYPYVIGTVLVFTVLWMPFWQVMLRKFGKKFVFRCAMLILMPGLIVLLFLNYFPYLIYPLAISGGAGTSGLYLIPWSMLPDVVDAAYSERGVRREELFYAYFVFGIKCSAGLSLGISTGIYRLGGYDQLKCDQPWSVPLMFKILVSGPPVILIIISLLFLHRYPITEEVRAETVKKLKARRQSKRDESAASIIRENGSIHPGVKESYTTFREDSW